MVDLRIKKYMCGDPFLVLDFNKVPWQFITMYDDTVMYNWVTYYTNLENWIFKIILMENRTISP